MTQGIAAKASVNPSPNHVLPVVLRTATWKRVSAWTALALISLAQVGCGASEVTTEPETPVAALISAPTSAALSCDLTVTVSFTAASSTGPVNSWMWLNDADSVLGRDQTLERAFETEGQHVTKLRVFSASLDSDEVSHTLAVGAPSGCLEAVVEGPNTLSIVPAEQVVAQYSAASSLGDIESYEWTVGGVVISESVDASLTLGEPGTYDLTLRVRIGERESTAEYRTVVLTRRPCPLEDRASSFAFYSEDRADEISVFLMDVTGRVSDPVVAVGPIPSFRTLASQHCGSGLVIGIRDLVTSTDLWVVDRDGTGLEALDTTNIIQSGPTWGVTDWIAYVDDFRWANAHDELAFIRPDGSEKFYAAGETLDEADLSFVGFTPTWDPTGTKIALGRVRLDGSVSGSPRRIFIFDALFGGSPQRAPLLTEMQIIEGYGTSNVNEGPNGVAWSPDGQWIAHGALIRGDLLKIVIVRTDGSGEVRILADGQDPTWSPDASALVYERQVAAAASRPFGNRHLFMISIEGGEEVDLSETTLTDTFDSTAAWWH